MAEFAALRDVLREEAQDRQLQKHSFSASGRCGDHHGEGIVEKLRKAFALDGIEVPACHANNDIFIHYL